MEVEQLEVALSIDIVVTSRLWKALQVPAHRLVPQFRADQAWPWDNLRLCCPCPVRSSRVMAAVEMGESNRKDGPWDPRLGVSDGRRSQLRVGSTSVGQPKITKTMEGSSTGPSSKRTDKDIPVSPVGWQLSGSTWRIWICRQLE